VWLRGTLYMHFVAPVINLSISAATTSRLRVAAGFVDTVMKHKEASVFPETLEEKHPNFDPGKKLRNSRHSPFKTSIHFHNSNPAYTM